MFESPALLLFIVSLFLSGEENAKLEKAVEELKRAHHRNSFITGANRPVQSGVQA